MWKRAEAKRRAEEVAAAAAQELLEVAKAAEATRQAAEGADDGSDGNYDAGDGGGGDSGGGADLSDDYDGDANGEDGEEWQDVGGENIDADVESLIRRTPDTLLEGEAAATHDAATHSAAAAPPILESVPPPPGPAAPHADAPIDDSMPTYYQANIEAAAVAPIWSGTPENEVPSASASPVAAASITPRTMPAAATVTGDGKAVAAAAAAGDEPDQMDGGADDIGENVQEMEEEYEDDDFEE